MLPTVLRRQMPVRMIQQEASPFGAGHPAFTLVVCLILQLSGKVVPHLVEKKNVARNWATCTYCVWEPSLPCNKGRKPVLGPWNVEEIITHDTCKGDFTHEVRADTTVVFVVGERDWARLQIQEGKVGIYRQGTRWGVCGWKISKQ